MKWEVDVKCNPMSMSRIRNSWTKVQIKLGTLSGSKYLSILVADSMNFSLNLQQVFRARGSAYFFC
jgi:hypothetical protein